MLDPKSLVRVLVELIIAAAYAGLAAELQANGTQEQYCPAFAAHLELSRTRDLQLLVLRRHLFCFDADLF